MKSFVIFAVFCAAAMAAPQHNQYNQNQNSQRTPTHEDLDTGRYPLELLEKFPYFLSGYDKEGAPVWILEFGKWDIRSVVESGGDLRWSFDNYMELAWQRMVESGQGRGGFNLIFNLEEYDPQQARHLDTLYVVLNNFGQKFGSTIKKEDLKKLFVLHENNEFDPIWRLNLNFWGNLIEQAEIYGNNKGVYIPRLLSVIPRTELPAHYGGAGNRWPAQIYG